MSALFPRASGERVSALIALFLLSVVFAARAEEPVEDWKTTFEKRMARKLTLDLVESPLEDALNTLRAATDVTFIIDPVLLKEGPPNVSVTQRSKPARDVFNAVLQQAGLAFELGEEAVFVYRQDTMSRRRASQRGELNAEDKAKLKDWVADLAAIDYRRRDAASRAIVGLSGGVVAELQEAQRATADPEVFLRIKRLLDTLAVKPFFTETPEVTAALDKLNQRMNGDFSFLPLREVLNTVSRVIGAEIRMSEYPDHQQTQLSLFVWQMKAGNVLRWAARLTNSRIHLKDGLLSFERNE